jgi:hypothetical protein
VAVVEVEDDADVEVVDSDMVVGGIVEGYVVDNLIGTTVDNTVEVPEAFVVDDLVVDLYWWRV